MLSFVVRFNRIGAVARSFGEGPFIPLRFFSLTLHHCYDKVLAF